MTDKTINRSFPYVECLAESCDWIGKTYNLVFAPNSYRDACPRCYSEKLEYFENLKGKNISVMSKKAASSTAMSMPDRVSDKAYVYTGEGSYKGWGDPLHRYERCYMTHKPLSLGGKMKIWGGSCSVPKKKNADIYIGFDRSMTYTEKSYPWVEGHELLFSIVDSSSPKNPESFLELIKWTAEQVRDGKSVHAGCVGGHGRTGLFLAALVSYMGVSKNPIEYVRKNYCKKAVESHEQIEFLEKHFGVKVAVGSKEFGHKAKANMKKKKKKKKKKTSFTALPDRTVNVSDLTAWNFPEK